MLTALSQIFLYTLAFNIGWSPLQVTYVVEILPYHLRAKVSKSLRLLDVELTLSIGTGALQPLCRRSIGVQSIRQPHRACEHWVEV